MNNNMKIDKQALETYDGIIPKALHRLYNPIKHMEYLKKENKKNYTVVCDYYLQSREHLKKHHTLNDIEELKKWLEENEQFKKNIMKK